MIHLDLFSGIGGFAYAADQVWDNVTHIFCDTDNFCRQVLRKHWPESYSYGDIADLIDNLERGIIVVCNEDMTASAQDVRSERKNMAQDTVNPATQSIWESGESQTSNTIGSNRETGTRKRSGQSTNTTAANVSVVEKPKKRSSPLTTLTEVATKNADSTTPKLGSSSSKTNTPTTTKSSATTAITQSTTKGSVPIKELKVDLLTGGFPCQPFSAAGKRKGTQDNRFKWPEMLKIIRLTKPEWVIAENVGGLVTWNGGLVLETVCVDLETAGYTVQPFIIPAVGVNAPHRRDRIWFIGHSNSSELDRAQPRSSTEESRQKTRIGQEDNPTRQFTGADKRLQTDRQSNGHVHDAANPSSQRQSGQGQHQRPLDSTSHKDRQTTTSPSRHTEWDKNWLEVATELCGLVDGLPVELGELKLSESKHRQEQLKAYGNAIVPQVAIEIMRAMV